MLRILQVPGNQFFPTWTVLVVVFLREEEKVIGTFIWLMAISSGMRNCGEWSSLVRRSEIEDGRVLVLGEWVGIMLMEEEREGVWGTVEEMTSVRWF